MKNILAIQDVYNSYNYKLDKEGENYAVFSLGGGVYPGVDILTSSNLNEDEYNDIKRNYSDAGFATTRVFFSSVENLELSLFKKFFKPDVAKKRLLKKYKQYTDKVMEPYRLDVESDDGNPEYEYMDISYSYTSDFKQQSNSVPIVDLLDGLVAENGPRLIIVEAAAGFGKTSTAYEILRRLSLNQTCSRPFYMELEKDRDANRFRFLLLSQFDREFDESFKHDFIISNITKGYIPLIIDGFDELLSRDIDEGKKKLKFKTVETMLSTISQLLKDQCKIILTTRKTAIFSGAAFMDWRDRQSEEGREFKVDIISLREPTFEDWIPEARRSYIHKIINGISNPVLLSYLRYAPIEDIKQDGNAESLIDGYFNSIFKREIKRQDIPFSVLEQKEILQIIAACFVSYELSSDKRSEIKDIILTYCSNLISKYQNSLSRVEDEQEALANKLVNHALLDRKESGNVGFINDFVFGTLVAEGLLNNTFTKENINNLSMAVVDKIIEATIVWNVDKRKMLATQILAISKLSSDVRFAIKRFLLNVVDEVFEGKLFVNQRFENISFSESGGFNGCTFTDCVFSNAGIGVKGRYTNCIFTNCQFDHQPNMEEDSNEYYPIVYPEHTDISYSIEVEVSNEEEMMDSEILQLFYKLGSKKDRPRYISWIIEELSGKNGRKAVAKRIERLISEGKIYAQGDIAWILKEGREYLKSIKNRIYVGD